MKLLANFEAPSFTRICYHSSEARDYWGKAFKLAGSVCWEAELRTAADGVRACGTCHIPNVGGDRMYEKLARYGLKWRRLTRVGPSAGFSHRRHAPLQEGDPNFSWFTVVSSDDANLDAFEAAHSKSDHNAMGDLLGFPSCCVGGFNEHWPEYCDPIWQAAQATPGVIELPYVGGPYSIDNPPDRPVEILQVRAHPTHKLGVHRVERRGEESIEHVAGQIAHRSRGGGERHEIQTTLEELVLHLCRPRLSLGAL